MIHLALAPLVIAMLASTASAPIDWTIQGGETVEYDTARGRLDLGRLHIQAGGTLRVIGDQPFLLTATEEVVIEGLLDLSGQDSAGVSTLNTTNQPEPGALGGPGAGAGGVGSAETNTSTPVGGSGEQAGGWGGESSYSDLGKADRRGAGGGGGALAAAQPLHSDVLHESNRGLIALRGWPGGPGGTGAVSQIARAQGGGAAGSVFTDADPSNDFWGRKITAAGLIGGELGQPLAGSGGGAGGDAVDSNTFPLMPFSPSGDEKGSGGGGGGGLGLILTRKLVLGPAGQLRVDGGGGGGGENTSFFDRVGGGSGGGSGGMLVIEAQLFDLSQAESDSITALGGLGGAGKDNKQHRVGAGGQGGPGLIQLHTPDGLDGAIQLPIGATLEQLTSPDAQVLLPVLR